MSEEYTLAELAELAQNIKEGLEIVQSFSNIGKFDYKIEFGKYEDGGWIRDISVKEYAAHKGKLRSAQIALTVQTSEFNPERPKDYVRYVQIDDGIWMPDGKDGEKYESNYETILEPSLKEFTGANTGIEGLEMLKGKYVEFRDVEGNPSRRDPDCEWRKPKLFAVFASREEAHQEYLNLTGGGGSTKSDNKSNDSGVWVPEGWAGSEQDFLDSIPFIKDDARPAPVVAKDYGIGVADVQKVKGM